MYRWDNENSIKMSKIINKEIGRKEVAIVSRINEYKHSHIKNCNMVNFYVNKKTLAGFSRADRGNPGRSASRAIRPKLESHKSK